MRPRCLPSSTRSPAEEGNHHGITIYVESRKGALRDGAVQQGWLRCAITIFGYVEGIAELIGSVYTASHPGGSALNRDVGVLTDWKIQMLRGSIACALSVSVAGCVTLKTAVTTDSKSGWEQTATRVELAKGVEHPEEPLRPRADPMKDPYQAVFEDPTLCGPHPSSGIQTMSVGVAAIPIIITAVTSAIKNWNVRQQRKLDALAEASKRRSDGRIVMSPAEFQDAKCVVFRRTAQAPDSDKNAQGAKEQDAVTNELVIVMRIERKKAGRFESGQLDHFYLTPVFVRAYNSIAKTKNDGTIDLAVGITLHQIASGGMPSLANLGMAATAIQDVPLTGEPRCAKPAKPAPCDSSSILPLPKDMGTIVLGLGVQEIGDLGFDVDIAKAQAEAIAGALGPLAGTLLSGHFEREAEREKTK